jgi:hypothetical protein
VQPSATTLNIICRGEYALSVDSINNQLLSENLDNLLLDGWTSMYKLAITALIAYGMDRDWASREGQLAFGDVEHLSFSTLENYSKMIDQMPSDGSKAS